MAKLTGKGVALPAEGYAFLQVKKPSFKPPVGVYVQETPAGPSLRRWPSRMPGRSEEFYIAREFLRAISLMYKLTDREVLDQYRRFALGTFLFPRDIMASAAVGRLFSITLPDGRVLYSVRAREVMSQALDVLSMVNGAMLYRAPWGWDALLPSTAGYVLRLNASGLPEWSPPEEVASFARSGIFTGLDLRGAGQGSGSRVLGNRRFAIEMVGTATSEATMYLRIASGRRSLSSRFLFENISQSGGNVVRLQFTLRVFDRDGVSILHTLPAENYTVPAQGQTFAVDAVFEDFDVPDGDGAAALTVVRYGASPDDTHNGIVGFYLVFWEWT
jgi:hypothetical protein